MSNPLDKLDWVRKLDGADVRPVGIYSLDPGTTSAVARGVFATRFVDSVWDGLEKGVWESWELTQPIDEQPWEIMGEYADWREAIAPVPTYLVIEDFVLRLSTGAASRRELLDPARVAHGCETLAWTREGLRWAHPEYQMPGDAGVGGKTGFATNARLRAHGMWVKGSVHRRDAVRHLCLRYSRLIAKRSR